MVITDLSTAEQSLPREPSEEFLLADETFATAVALQLLLGKLYGKKGNFKKSIRHLQDAIKGAERLSDNRLLTLGYSFLGDVYYREGRRGEAKAAYRRAIELESVLPARMGLADVYHILEGLKEVSLPFERAVELDPRNVWTYYGVGVAYSRKGDYEAAITKFIHCIDMSPHFLPPRVQLAAIYYEQGNYPAAVSEYQKAIEICRVNDELLPDLYFGLGDAYRAQANYDLAVTSYQKAIKALRSFQDERRAKC